MSRSWRNHCPGDLSIQLPELHADEVEPALAAASAAADAWARLPLAGRADALRRARGAIEAIQADLARAIALETGKPLGECQGELAAVLAKFELTLADAQRYLSEEVPADAPHPSVIRRRPRGPAVVIGPFNFPIHLPHGQIVAYLAAGNPVIFKPSPAAGNVCAKYAQAMCANLPPGVFSLVQGGAEEAQALVTDRRVRAVGFTGSVSAGKAIAAATAGDLGKDLALELGGKCAAIVCADADLDQTARMCAEAACLTAGQRCNATSRIIVDRSVLSAFLERFLPAIHNFAPGDPLDPATRLGPLINEAAHERYRRLIELPEGQWLKRGHVPAVVAGKVGYYVEPAVLLLENPEDAARSTLARSEIFAPIVVVIPSDSDPQTVQLHNDTPFGLTASVFTRSRDRFNQLADRLWAGNIYGNLPTTASPSQLPFGGWGDSGNGHPGGRGFVRFTAQEQVIQVAGGSMA
ncbi:MAG: aldehyde dehydrogenase family protein [Phycisphaerae bacterium]|nr:aldehyde dehydrogenase family protein [Phycisphaerae bacterium]MDW8261436.1 aldehyde dehydrogenase family protein [Phycisphaerales bacterium]